MHRRRHNAADGDIARGGKDNSSASGTDPHGFVDCQRVVIRVLVEQRGENDRTEMTAGRLLTAILASILKEIFDDQV